uniref:Uncharacterized protein n=1 Tax=Rhizophora mucronata TaxID=61149 RepID=A0A2P2MKQ7_RHIMU
MTFKSMRLREAIDWTWKKVFPFFCWYLIIRKIVNFQEICVHRER